MKGIDINFGHDVDIETTERCKKKIAQKLNGSVKLEVRRSNAAKTVSVNLHGNQVDRTYIENIIGQNCRHADIQIVA